MLLDDISSLLYKRVNTRQYVIPSMQSEKYLRPLPANPLLYTFSVYIHDSPLILSGNLTQLPSSNIQTPVHKIEKKLEATTTSRVLRTY